MPEAAMELCLFMVFKKAMTNGFLSLLFFSRSASANNFLYPSSKIFFISGKFRTWPLSEHFRAEYWIRSAAKYRGFSSESGQLLPAGSGGRNAFGLVLRRETQSAWIYQNNQATQGDRLNPQYCEGPNADIRKIGIACAAYYRWRFLLSFGLLIEAVWAPMLPFELRCCKSRVPLWQSCFFQYDRRLQRRNEEGKQNQEVSQFGG